MQILSIQLPIVSAINYPFGRLLKKTSSIFSMRSLRVWFNLSIRRLALATTAEDGGSEASQRALENVDTAAHIAEAVALAGFLKEAGPKAHPLTLLRIAYGL